MNTNSYANEHCAFALISQNPKDQTSELQIRIRTYSFSDRFRYMKQLLQIIMFYTTQNPNLQKSHTQTPSLGETIWGKIKKPITSIESELTIIS